jgi:hypothetical protein
LTGTGDAAATEAPKAVAGFDLSQLGQIGGVLGALCGFLEKQQQTQMLSAERLAQSSIEKDRAFYSAMMDLQKAKPSGPDPALLVMAAEMKAAIEKVIERVDELGEEREPATSQPTTVIDGTWLKSLVEKSPELLSQLSKFVSELREKNIVVDTR